MSPNTVWYFVFFYLSIMGLIVLASYLHYRWKYEGVKSIKYLSKAEAFFAVTLMFLLRTRHTETRLRRMFCRVCELDYTNPINFGWFEIMAYGNSISIECFDGYKFVMNESDSLNGIKVSTPIKEGVWREEYQTKRVLKSLEWFKRFSLIYETLLVNKVFETRQKENLEKASLGVMH